MTTIYRRVGVAIILFGCLVASGLLETQRLQVMQETSAEATMAAMGIQQ